MTPLSADPWCLGTALALHTGDRRDSHLHAVLILQMRALTVRGDLAKITQGIDHFCMTLESVFLLLQ